MGLHLTINTTEIKRTNKVSLYSLTFGLLLGIGTRFLLFLVKVLYLSLFAVPIFVQQVFEMTLFRGLFLLHFGVHLLEIDSDNWKFQFYRLEEVTLEEQYNASYPCCSSYNSLAIHWNTKCCCWSTAQIKATGWN